MRREEDLRAMLRLASKPYWLEFSDSQYGAMPCVLDIARAIEAAVERAGSKSVAMPLGLFHSDHVLTSDAALLVMRRHQDWRWLAYEEPGYGDLGDERARRLEELERRGICVQAVEPAARSALKTEAMSEYRSQLRGLGKANPGVICAAGQSEGLYRISVTKDTRTAVVLLTYNRRVEVLHTLERMSALPENPAIIVVDNGSSDGTVEAVRAAFPAVDLLQSEGNIGGAARNLGLAHANMKYVALCDDDTWWEPGSLGIAADLLDAHADVALICGRVLVGESQRVDPVSEVMATSPLAAPSCLPGPSIQGFLAGAAYMRREAVLGAGGFHRHFFIGGEEELLALDLEAAGHALAYCDWLTVRHYPSPQRNKNERRWILERNALWVAWLRRPLLVAVRKTLGVLKRSVRHRGARRGLIEAAKGIAWVRQERRRLPDAVEQRARQLEES